MGDLQAAKVQEEEPDDDDDDGEKDGPAQTAQAVPGRRRKRPTSRRRRRRRSRQQSLAGRSTDVWLRQRRKPERRGPRRKARRSEGLMSSDRLCETLRYQERGPISPGIRWDCGGMSEAVVVARAVRSCSRVQPGTGKTRRGTGVITAARKKGDVGRNEGCTGRQRLRMGLRDLLKA